MARILYILFFAVSLSFVATAQKAKIKYSPPADDTTFIAGIFSRTLEDAVCYEWLRYLCKQIGPRLSGTPAYMAAAIYTQQMLDTLGIDTVYHQPVSVPHWERGENWPARVVSSAMGSFDLNSLALGNTVATPPEGITAEVIEVHSLEQLEALGATEVRGKIVFFNRPMETGVVRTMTAYGRAVDQRYRGPGLAAELGAAATLVRSMTPNIDDIPHTGGTQYRPEGPNIPALALSTVSAEKLAAALRSGPVRVFLRNASRHLPDKPAANVIGEIRGSEFPDEIIVVGGHLDSWDIGEGAHDDGAGCVQAMQVLRTFRMLGYQPRRTIRCVLFANEENGLQGGLEYARRAAEKKEKHIAALESDAGGHAPRGFSFEGRQDIFVSRFRKVGPWIDLLSPYGLHFNPGGSGADISPLKEQGPLLIGLDPELHRYFDYHHAATDVFEAVNKRELAMGAGAMAALIYLIDKYGL